ncbi:DUF6880 family protein [Arthrobacter castelli]|uniref:DUF6880 family protein n=1 Tax=Arthrobacter castelli TaxID=271431 RepID=UPI0012DBE031|nr:DUF6880 family protein [Arthrobacter castelli]
MAETGHGDVVAYLKADVMPLFRTRRDLHWRSAANEYAWHANEGARALRLAATAGDAAAVLPYVQKAISSMVRVVLRADDSDGSIGGIIGNLLELHAEVASIAPPPASKLVAWLIKFQFDGTQDFFTIDIVRYAGALGNKGMAKYRDELHKIAESLPPEPTREEEHAIRPVFGNSDAYEEMITARHNRFLLNFNAQRLAVVDGDADAVIARYGGDQNMAYQMRETAAALAEIGHIEQALTFARRGAAMEPWHQADQAAELWCTLVAEHRPDELAPAHREVFDHRPTSSAASRLRKAMGSEWPQAEPEVLAALESRPRDLVLFLLLDLDDPQRAWDAAQRLAPADIDVLTRVVDAYGEVDPGAVIPTLRELIESDLAVADARNYRSAVKRMRKLRKFSAAAGQPEMCREYILSLLEEHRNRPRFVREVDRAGLL